MKILLTLEEMQIRCNDWEYFCEEEGWSLYSVNEGGGDIEICLTEKESYKYGVLTRHD